MIALAACEQERHLLQATIKQLEVEVNELKMRNEHLERRAGWLTENTIRKQANEVYRRRSLGAAPQ